MNNLVDSRRRLIVAGAGLLAAGSSGQAVLAAKKSHEGTGQDKEVGAVEDLMREQGVLRRAILIYRKLAADLRTRPQAVDSGLLRRTARLFRDFGEDYHENRLEEAHIFPRMKQAGGPAAAYVDVLLSQHRRGREITEYVLSLTSKGALGTAEAEPLSRVLDSFELMYEHHAAREDTVVFPAWKQALSNRELGEMGEEFEKIERAQFGKDGFEHAVSEVASIEQSLGIADISQFTAPSPPRL